MFRRIITGLSLLVAILAIGARVAISEHGKDAKSATAGMAGKWILDPSQSDPLPGMGPDGERGGSGSRPRGGWGERRRGGGAGGAGTEGGDRPAGRGRMARLPDWMRIVQEDDGLSIVDSIGSPTEEIKIGSPVPKGSENSADAAPVLSGKWKDGRLEIVRDGRRGRMTQTFALKGDGSVLVIRTKVESKGPMPSREFKRVYRRSST